MHGRGEEQPYLTQMERVSITETTIVYLWEALATRDDIPPISRATRIEFFWPELWPSRDFGENERKKER
jgi:hypothetical protein